VRRYFCLSGGSHTNAKGHVHNPRRHGYSAGGSSSGSAALVAAGEIDMAIGGDQGGSIRIPTAYCGVYGMKPSWGLVPYTGVMPIESTIDHVGPITASVADNALLLEVLVGPNALDPRQYAPLTVRYTEALGRSVAGLKIGSVREGFGWANSEPDVDEKTREAAQTFAKLGAAVEEVSIPLHRLGKDIWAPIALEGMQAQMMKTPCSSASSFSATIGPFLRQGAELGPRFARRL
jgi:amidase